MGDDQPQPVRAAPAVPWHTGRIGRLRVDKDTGVVIIFALGIVVTLYGWWVAYRYGVEMEARDRANDRRWNRPQ